MSIEDHVPTHMLPKLSRQELSKYTTDPVYIAVLGDVFDVTGVSFYEKGGPYGAFAGKDVTRALAKTSLKPGDINCTDVHDLTSEELETARAWHEKFLQKYELVGKIKVDSKL